MLTDMKCRTAKPKEKLYRLNDFNGLYLEVKPNGEKAWRYRFKLNGILCQKRNLLTSCYVSLPGARHVFARKQPVKHPTEIWIYVMSAS